MREPRKPVSEIWRFIRRYFQAIIFHKSCTPLVDCELHGLTNRPVESRLVSGRPSASNHSGLLYSVSVTCFVLQMIGRNIRLVLFLARSIIRCNLLTFVVILRSIVATDDDFISFHCSCRLNFQPRYRSCCRDVQYLYRSLMKRALCPVLLFPSITAKNFWRVH